MKKNVITHPYKIAVFSSERNLTYKDLDIMSDNIAKALLKFNSKYVIVNYPHSFELIPIVYGILKAGKVYIPVDYTSSNLEINNIKKKFNNYIYLSDTFSDVPITKTINLPHQIIDYLQNEIAYIIHTSGTTGQPKGVCISRKNLNYILNACQTIAPISKNDCYLFSTRNTFDVSITEMFSFLYSGGSAFVYSVKSKDFYKRLPQAIEQYHITHIALSPSVLSMLLKYNNKDSLNIIDKLKYLIVAGEEFKTELLEQVNKKLFKVNILNVYGPTETTVYATSFNVRKTSSNAQRVPIGSPLPGVKVLIQNNELLIGGEGVSLGYFNDSQKTKQAFEKINNQLFYHTGDIVKKENHNIIYLDRKDNQIQIYGIRVELGDIRSLISKVINDSSRELEVTYENKILTLYYTGKLIPNLRKKLEQHIVSYKIPTRYINLPSFPLTSSGKIDRKKLTSTTFMKPVDSLSLSTNNSQIFNIVKKSTETILNQSIEPNDNLLNSGLDSLNSIELILSLEQQLNINLDNLNLYSYPSINKITSFIENTKILSSSKTKSQTNNSSNIQIKNIPINQKIEYTFPAYFYAKIYHSLNFNSKLYGRIFLGKHRISYEEIYHKLSKVEVFKTILSKDLSTFEVLDTPINISKFQVNKARTNLKDKLKNAVDLSINRHGLLYKFVYLEDENEAILYYSIDHSICDTGSLDALERYILGVYDESTNYSKYINEVFKHNTLTNVLKELDTFNTQNNTKVLKILSNLENKISFVNLHFLDTKTKNIYSEILIFLKNKLLEAYDIDKLKVNLIFNIRKFDNNIDYSSTIGDLHIGLTYLLKKDIDVAKELDNLILQYKNKMFNPKAIGYKHFPNMNSNEKKIIKCFDDTVYVSIDYLGIVSADDFKKIKKILSILIAK